MQRPSIDVVYDELKSSLAGVIDDHGLAGSDVRVHCRALDAAEAIGSPEDQDYPILQGREHMVEARFGQARGQAFADEFENHGGPVESMLTMDVDTTARRAVFIAGLNAVFRHCERCETTVHCRDEEPRDCAKHLREILAEETKVLLVGLQPRFLEEIARTNPLRVVDMDPRFVGTQRCGIEIESATATADAVEWCDTIVATGSTIVNGTITHFLGLDKPVVFFGVTISAAAVILGLDTFCHAPDR